MNSVTQVLATIPGAVGERELIAFLLRLTLVVAIGRLALAAATRASAATRHLVATATLAVALLMPLATALLPEWRLPILPSASVAERPSPRSPEAGAHPPALLTTEYYGDPSIEAVAPEAGTAAPSFLSIPRRLLPLSMPIRWPFLLALLAIGVSELLLARLGLSLLMAAAFTGRAHEVRDPRLRQVFDRARARLGVPRSVELRITERVSVPVVSGLIRPTLLLPLEAEAWDSERLEIVFLHELAHVQRRDIVGLVLAKTAAAVYWFHPIVWSLHRHARRDCERACDDRVLQSGVRASDYAEQLLAIARRASALGPGHGAVLAIAGRSNLERRLRSILSAGEHRDGPSRRAIAFAALLALLTLVPLATVRVTAAPARRASELRAEVAPATLLAAEAGGAALEAELAAGTIAVPAGKTAESSGTISGSEWYSRARHFYDRERYGAAALAFERAARGGCQIAKSLYNAACSYALDDQPDQALALLEQAVEAGWDEIHLIRSDDDLDTIRDDPRYDRILERARSIDPDEAEQATARAQFEALRSSGTSDPEAWGDAGITLLRAGEPALAAQAFEKQIGLESSSNAIYNLACAQAQNHETAKALATLERAILAGYGDAHHMRQDDDLAPLRRERRFGELRRMAEDLELDFHIFDSDSPRRWRRDLPGYEGTTRTYPRAGRAWFNLGYVQLRAREPGAARASFQRSLDLQYRPGTTMYNLACAAAQLRDFDAAMEWLDQSEEAGMRLENHARNDRDLSPLRSDPRFRALLRRLEERQRDEEERRRDEVGSKIKRLFDKM